MMPAVSDPVRLEVVRNALEGIADGMALTVVRTSRSTIVRTSLDFSTAILNARGGLGMVRQYRFLADETLVQVRSDRMKYAPYGLAGGEASRNTRIAIRHDDEKRAMPSKFLTTVHIGDVMRAEWPGAGGWGNPLDRDPLRVLQDVVEEKVSVQRAREKYGVVINEEARAVDWEATRALRESLRHKR